MRGISFLPLTGAAGKLSAEGAALPAIEALPTASQVYSLSKLPGGELVCVPLSGDEYRVRSGENAAHLMAIVCSAGTAEKKAWFLIPRSDALGVNGIAPPLPLARLDPGAMLSLGPRCWLVVAVWQPQPGEAPPELAQKPCPVCGGQLAMAPVVQCACGRWTHLERPEQPQSPDALNCYLAAGTCGDCGRAATLKPQIVPEPPEKLLPAAAGQPGWP